MILLQAPVLNTVDDARKMLQTAIGVEFGTLPPYLYSLYSIKPGTNPQAQALIKSVALQEMIHMCLACNMLNALGGAPQIVPQAYPGPLPGDIGPDGSQLTLHLYPFTKQAMQQAMEIESPENPPDYPVRMRAAAGEAPKAVTIGQFYRALDQFLSTLPASDWTANRNQIADNQFFAGQLFAINNYADAHQAIDDIVSEGEGSTQGTVPDPLDFEDQLAHYYRFGEIFNDKVLTRAKNPLGYQWGPEPLGVDWSGAWPAIADPALHDFSKDPPAAQQAQHACTAAFTSMVDGLRLAVTGTAGALGNAVRAMFDLRMAALHAFSVPLADGKQTAGPAFVYQSPKAGGKS